MASTPDTAGDQDLPFRLLQLTATVARAGSTEIGGKELDRVPTVPAAICSPDGVVKASGTRLHVLYLAAGGVARRDVKWWPNSSASIRGG